MVLMNGGSAVVETLHAAGVTHVFGLLGSSTMEVYDALYDSKHIKYVGVRHEAFGVHMSDGFARAKGKPGVFLAGQAGPGSVNMVAGLAAAKLAYSPVVCITGLVASDHFGRDAFQEIDQHNLFAPLVKKNITVMRPDRIPEAIEEALRLANSGRRGPVVVNVPRDMFASQIEANIKAPDFSAGSAKGTINPAAITKVCDLLKSAKAPVILAGAGVKWGRGAEQVCRLSSQLQIPITASAGHPDVVPSSHALFAGQVGPRGNEVASMATREADVILAIGTRLAFNTTFYNYNDINRDAKIVQIDIEPSVLGKYFPIEVGIIGDAGSVAGSIADEMTDMKVESLPWKARTQQFLLDLEQLWRTRNEEGKTNLKPLRPERVFFELRQSVPENTLFTLDAGTMCLQATDRLKYYGAPAMLTPLDYGLVGFAFPCGLGAKCAEPGRTVVSLHGDGGFGMVMPEFATSMQSEINTITVVLDNGCWGAEKSYQRDFYQGRYIGCDTLNPRYDEFAKLYGASGFFCNEPGSLADAMSEAVRGDRPAIIHVKVDPEAMVSFRRDAFTHKAQQ